MHRENVPVQSVRIESIDDLRSPIANSDIEITQLGTGRLRGHLMRGEIGEVAFSLGSFSNELRAAGVFSRTHTTIGVLLENSHNSIVWGVEVEPGGIMWTPPGGDHDIRYSGQASFAGLSIRPEELAALLAGENRLGDLTTWTRMARCRPNSRENLDLGCALRAAALLLEQHGAVVPESTRDFWKRCVVEAFVAGILRTVPQPVEPIPSTVRLIREVEHYIDSHRFRPVHLSEVCTTLGLSRRTLHRAFHDVMGIGAAAFLRRKRLCHVHSRLRRSDPRQTQITHVATEFGFVELGRFSQYYRALFGEYPSETLWHSGSA